MENGGFAAPSDLERNGTIKGECQNKFLTAEQTNGVRFLYNIENSKIKPAHKMLATAHSLSVIMDLQR